MKLVISVGALLLLLGCNNDSGADSVALAEARARTAEAEARVAEARAAEAAAHNSAVAEPAPAPSSLPGRVVAEPMVDYEPFARPRTAYVQTESVRMKPRQGTLRRTRSA